MSETGMPLPWPQLQARLSLRFSDTEFETYFKNARLHSWEGHHVVLEAADPFRREWMQQQQDRIAEVLRESSGDTGLSVAFRLPEKEDLKARLVVAERVVHPAPVEERQTPLNASFTFTTFIVGPSNRFAQAACRAVAENPSKSYNPLVLYGGVGLGKTHLLHAIGNLAAARNPGTRALYITSENFMNEMISVLRSGGDMRLFREKFRNADVLLIDDIQFLAGKESTQEEFFHTFNDLHSHGKQIVATSDIPPREINLDERLRNRFEWGLVADIGRPDYETRLAILRKKAQSENRGVPEDVLEFLARTFTHNVRELEGSLVKIMALSSILDKEINLDLAKEALRDLLKAQARPISIDLIQEAVTTRFNLKLSDMKARKRTDAVAYPRQIAMYLSRELTPASLPEIGNAFGGRDHTTVIHAINKIEQKMKQDTDLAATIESLIQQVKGVA
ncbi:MAG TPA: chromosomal replication initiator protein DnaA [bacterium]|jgi:chromosomal replication initiator protein|nr:chromosomal replication initiator protein DnaA [bacterium]